MKSYINKLMTKNIKKYVKKISIRCYPTMFFISILLFFASKNILNYNWFESVCFMVLFPFFACLIAYLIVSKDLTNDVKKNGMTHIMKDGGFVKYLKGKEFSNEEIHNIGNDIFNLCGEKGFIYFEKQLKEFNKNVLDNNTYCFETLSFDKFLMGDEQYFVLDIARKTIELYSNGGLMKNELKIESKRDDMAMVIRENMEKIEKNLMLN